MAFLNISPAISAVSSILSPADIATFVRIQYALPTHTTCQLIKAGINHTYKMDAGDNRFFIFRIYSCHWRTIEEINEELQLLLLLQQNHVAVSYPIADHTAQFVQSIQAPEGLRFAVLFSYAPGNKIQHYDKDIHFEIGKLMAQMHRLTNGKSQKRITYTPNILLHQSLHHIQQFLSEDTEEMQFLLTTRPILEKQLSDAANMRTGIVHLDIWFDNLNISDQHNITLFDFDFCGNGWLCLDIAYYIMQLHNTEKIAAERTEKIDAFYAGYQTIEQISSTEKQLIPTLGVCLYYFYLGVQCSRFDNWSNTFLNEGYIKRYINLFIKHYYQITKQ